MININFWLRKVYFLKNINPELPATINSCSIFLLSKVYAGNKKDARNGGVQQFCSYVNP